MRNGHRFLVPLFIVVSVLLLPGQLRADVTGSISGVVRDRSQAAVTGARVTVTNTQTNLSQEIASGADGSFHFLALPAGTYRLGAKASGFKPYLATDITLQVNDQLKLDIVLD